MEMAANEEVVNGDRNEEYNGHSSPDSGVNMPESSGDKTGPNSNSTEGHTVHVYLDAGELLNVRMGDTVRPVIGPATIRMVSNNGPPTPMQMRAPQGHMVQQIVDENNVLTHVILGPQPPPNHMGQPGPSFHYNASGRNVVPGIGGYNYNGVPPQGPNFPPNYHPQYHHHPLQVQGGMHLTMGGARGLNAHCNNQGQSDERTERKNQQLREKVQRHFNNKPESITAMRAPLFTTIHQPLNVNGSSPRSHDMYSCSSSTDSHDTAEEEKRHLLDALSNILPPQISSIEARKAVVSIQPPVILNENMEPQQNPEIQYEIQFSERIDGKYMVLYKGDANVITMKDLRPSTDFFVRVFAIIEDVRGQGTEPVNFRTQPDVPDVPPPPRVAGKGKHYVSLKLVGAGDNGSEITNFILEYAEGTGDDARFVECCNELVKQFKLNKLTASQCYTFRLAAANACGRSDYSDVTSVWTPGSSPPAPDPPRLSDCMVDSLLLTWIKRPIDREFCLQKEEEGSPHGFLVAYTGPEVSYKVTKLEKSKSYRFRLSSSNDYGKSGWSDVQTYSTRAGIPSSPSRLTAKGKIHSSSFRLIWDAPKEDGGAPVEVYIAQLDQGSGFQNIYEGPHCECNCSNLLPGFTCKVRVAGRNVSGQGYWSEVASITTKPVPPKACEQPLLHGKPKAHFLHLKWSAPRDTGGAPVKFYCVQLIYMDNTSREVYRGHELECKVAGLSPGRCYLLQVKAANDAGEGEWSEPLEVLSGAGVPEAPAKPECVCQSAHVAIISWPEPCNNGAKISQYRLDWLKPGTQSFAQLHAGQDLGHEVKDLQPATEYSFRVSAVNSSGSSNHSEPVTVITPPSSPSTVNHVRTSTTATTVCVKWQEPESNGSQVTQYTVEWGKHLFTTVSGNETECIIDDLEPNTTYRIRVQAANAVGVGPYSSTAKVTTLSLPPPPPVLECVSSTYNTVKLRWKDSDTVYQYTVSMTRENNFDNAHPVFNGKSNNCRVTKLQESSEYQFRITASNDAGEGPPSEPISAITTKAPPHSIKAPTANHIAEHSCRLEWQTCKSVPGDTIEYRLQTSTGSHDFKQVYQGKECKHTLDGLESGCSYTVRVCPIRFTTSQQGEPMKIPGAYTPGTTFTTLKPLPVQQHRQTTHKEERNLKMTLRHLYKRCKPESEKQLAIVAMLGVLLFGILMAMLVSTVIG